VTENGQRYNSDARLELRADVRTELQVTPGFIDFGTVASGAKTSKTATLKYHGKMADWKITQADTTNKNIDVKLTPPTQPGGAFTIEASLTASLSGDIRDEIRVQTNDPAVPALTIAVVGKVEAPYSLFPGDVLRFEKPVVVGTRAEMNVIVRTVGKPFTVKKVDGLAHGLSVQLLPVLPTKTQTLPISFTPTQPGAIKQVLTFTLDSGERIQLTVIATAVAGKE
jgi:hypothetical protein